MTHTRNKMENSTKPHLALTLKLGSQVLGSVHYLAKVMISAKLFEKILLLARTQNENLKINNELITTLTFE